MEELHRNLNLTRFRVSAVQGNDVVMSPKGALIFFRVSVT